VKISSTDATNPSTPAPARVERKYGECAWCGDELRGEFITGQNYDWCNPEHRRQHLADMHRARERRRYWRRKAARRRPITMPERMGAEL
jgi:hypothetical protein